MKRFFSLLLALVFAFSIVNMTVGAKTYSDKAIIYLSKKNVTVGSVVTVTVSHTSSYPMASIQSELTYNNAVLQFVSGESGNTANQGSTVKIVKDSAPTNSISVSVKFKAIAAGSGSLSYKGKSFSADDDGNAAAGTSVDVKEVKPSTNNNLGSLRISEGNLTPAFRAGRLNYTATVKYDVTNITINANAAAGDAKVAGVGTFDLNVGNNTNSVTVTAASGDKKTYTIRIKRMSEEETAAEENKERENNPLFFICDGADRFMVPNISNLPEFEGYEKDIFENKNTEIGYYKDKSGKYNLVWATDESGKNGAFYNREADEKYTKINYLQISERLYVIEPFESDINVGSQFTLSEQEVNGENVECYRYNDEQMKDFCIIYCYLNGESDYYKFDATQNTVQREPMFLSSAQETEVKAEAEAPEEGIFEIFKRLGTQAKILILLLCFSALLIFALIILLIIKAASAKGVDIEDGDIDYDASEDSEDSTDVPEENEDEAPSETDEQEADAEQEEALPEEETQEEAADLLKDNENIDTSEFIDMDEDF